MSFSDCIKSVENVELTMTGVSSVSYTLTKGQNTANCVPFTTHYVSGTSGLLYRCLIESYFVGNDLYLKRGHTTGNVYASTYVVEFDPSYVKVQQGTFSIVGTADTTTTISGVDVDKTFIFCPYSTTSTSNLSYNHFTLSELTTASGITHTRGNTDGNISGRYYVVECIGDDFSVQHISSDFSGTGGGYNLETAYPTHRQSTFTIASHYTTSNVDDPEDAFIRPYLGHMGYSIHVDRASTTNAIYYNVDIIHTSEDTNVVYLSGSALNAGEATSVVSSVPKYSDKMFIVPTTVGSYGRCAGTAATNNECGFCRITYSSVADTLTSTRSATTTPARIPYNVVDSSGITYTDNNVETPVKTNNFIKSIENLNTSIGTATSYYVYMSKNQSLSNTVPLYSCCFESVSATYVGTIYYSQFLIDPAPYFGNSFFISRWDGSTNSISLNLYLLEFNPEQIRVQGGYFKFSDASYQITLDYEVNVDKTFVIVYYVLDNTTTNYYSYFTRYILSSSTTIDLVRGNATGNISGYYYVVEDLGDNFNVVRGTITMGAGSTSATDTLSSYVSPNKTIGLFSHYTTHALDDPEDAFMSGQYINNSTVNISRANSDGIIYAAYQLVEFTDDSIDVYNDGATTTLASTTIKIKEVDQSSAVVFTTNPLSICRCTGTASTAAESAWTKFSFYDDNTLQCDLYAGYTALTRSQIVHFPKIPTHYFTGTVKEGSSFIDRLVSAYRADTGELMGRCTSSGTKGYYIETTYSGAHYIVCQDDYEGVDYNDLISGKVYPELIGPTTWEDYYGD